ncbi:diguanylate cyclase [Massilia sp. CCM 8733]|uniref:Diguanylate cyclase n=1 Tax=Massilia mucilaginosa TaxID=2609282 RepID=A0ABX0NS15_9BURK|nr:sensor domain-containing diguanylate cyclase [Massilia mucilaginosa]NHZ89564.1 diguanylate cyclase [Massilia mucilaginosa]
MKSPSIRTRLVTLVLGCVLPIAVVAALLIFEFYEREQAQLISNAISQARAMVSAIDRDFGRTQAALEALATSHRLATGDLKGFHSRALGAVKNMQADSIVVVDASGQLLLSTRRPFGEPLPKLTTAPLLKRIIKTGKPGVSDLYIGPVVGRFIYTVAVPVKRDGAFLYLLNATAPPTQLAPVLTEQKLPPTWRASIVDSTGAVVVRTHDLVKFLGKKVNPDLLQRMANADEDSFKTKTLDGIPVITVYSRSQVSRWSVVLGMPLEQLTLGLRETLTQLIVATFAALGLGIALAWFIGGRVATSIVALTKPAIALALGETAIVIAPLYFEEANAMGRALQDTAKSLQHAKHEAQHDGLTGLANRSSFHLVVNQHLALCLRNKTGLAILFIDLDGFKAVNDTFGHAVGDQLLKTVSIRITDAVRESDFCARLGGDEFAIALLESDLEQGAAFAQRLIEIVSEPYPIDGITATVSASVGVAAFPASATSTDTLLKKADQAMYHAKVLGKRRCCVAT